MFLTPAHEGNASMSEVTGAVAAAQAAFAKAERGDASAVPSALAALTGGEPVVTAWRLALSALQTSIDPTSAAPPAVGEVVALSGTTADAQRVAARACSRMELASALTFDGSAAQAWAEARGRLEAPGPTPWTASVGALVRGEALEPIASNGEPTAERIAGAALAAVRGASPELDPALIAQAKEACRLARQTGLAELEYLTNLALARLRRISGRPHLALHILTALGASAPPPWRPWIAWETLLAGSDSEARALLAARGTEPLRRSPAFAMTEAGLAVLSAAQAGDGEAFTRAHGALRAALPRWEAPRAESDTLAALLNPHEPAVSEEVREWRRGQRTQAPFGLYAVGVSPSGALESERGYAYVFAPPGTDARRLLRPGLPLIGHARNLEGPDEAGKGGFRTETGLAVLALAGPEGLSREEFVRTLYGFKYVPLRHQGVLDVLVHRMRARLDEDATLERSAEHRLSLKISRPLVIPDGRCTIGTGERVLRALATLGWTGAQDASVALRIPRRTVHRALQELVADGACKVSRSGGKLLYRVHDTTFTVLTLPPPT